MERIKELGRYQKAILVLLIAMVSVFTILYSIAFSKTGFLYADDFLEMRSEDGNTVYTGNVDGEKLTFTVTKENEVICQYGDKTYGPFTAKKDPTAVPKGNGRAEDMVGVEIRDGEKILFRGGVLVTNERALSMVLVDEKTGDMDFDISASVEPSAHMILNLVAGPELIKGGNVWSWLGGVLAAAMTALSILFTEELFHFAMSFRVRYAELTEPSDWEIISRYAGWTLGTVGTLVFFFSGLTMYIR